MEYCQPTVVNAVRSLVALRAKALNNAATLPLGIGIHQQERHPW